MSAHGAEVSVVTEGLPGLPVELVGLMHFCVFGRCGLFRRDRGVGLLVEKIGEELVGLLLAQPVAEGCSEFFAAPSTNSTSTWATRAAAFSTAETNSRKAGSVRISMAFSLEYGTG